MFIVCGEALMDVFAAGDTPTGMTLDARIGGSPFNVAMGLARMGQPVSLLSAISTGFLGERLMQALVSEGVHTDLVQRTASPTTLSLVGLDAQRVPSYAFYGEGGADRQLRMDALQNLPAHMRALHFASYATVVEPIASTLRALIAREHQRTVISFDPNVRLNVESRVQTWVDHLQWMLPRTHLLKISDEDLGLLLPDMSLEAFATLALSQGVKLVVVTRGAEGALGWTARTHASVGRKPVQVVDTVGAGDTFQAALLTWLQENGSLSVQGLADLSSADLELALHFAGHAAGITCSRRGADLPRRAELG